MSRPMHKCSTDTCTNWIPTEKPYCGKCEAKQRKPRRNRYATREEQHARYIDCGPQAWDDNDNPDY